MYLCKFCYMLWRTVENACNSMVTESVYKWGMSLLKKSRLRRKYGLSGLEIARQRTAGERESGVSDRDNYVQRPWGRRSCIFFLMSLWTFHRGWPWKGWQNGASEVGVFCEENHNHICPFLKKWSAAWNKPKAAVFLMHVSPKLGLG